MRGIQRQEMVALSLLTECWRTLNVPFVGTFILFLFLEHATKGA